MTHIPPPAAPGPELSRTQIEQIALGQDPWEQSPTSVEDMKTLCAMALASIDASAEIEGLRKERDGALRRGDRLLMDADKLRARLEAAERVVTQAWDYEVFAINRQSDPRDTAPHKYAVKVLGDILTKIRTPEPPRPAREEPPSPPPAAKPVEARTRGAKIGDFSERWFNGKEPAESELHDLVNDCCREAERAARRALLFEQWAEAKLAALSGTPPGGAL